MKILGIETSCDETAIAIVEAEGGLESPRFSLLGSCIQSQIEMHREFGGVVPNIAKREHLKNLPIVLGEALKKASVQLENLEKEIDAIAVTVGPGLEPALWTGINFAEEISRKYGIKIIPTNHMEGHIASVLLKQRVPLGFPALALLISGGHTELVLMQSWTDKKVLGETMDDAVGEAFDKVARMLGLPYPGGPEISRLASQAREQNLQLEIRFPRPMLNSGDYNFSFSGLKTAVLYYLRDIIGKPEDSNVAREFEDAVTEVLVSKSKKAILEFGPQTFIVGGGVIANQHIRQEIEKLLSDFPGIKLLIPEKSLTTDNAVMIAMAGYLTHLSLPISPGQIKSNLKAQGNLRIG